jgi:murein DD-endopeptidase MepM/ murein hydrolase activator NlpD
VSIGPYGNPSPSPEGGTALSTPVQAPTPSPGAAAPTTASTGAIDPNFLTWINQIISTRLGSVKAALIPDADKQALIEKIWADPTVQSTWSNSQAALSSTDPKISGPAGGIVSQVINNVMAGQGNDSTIAIDYTNMIQQAGEQLTTAELSSLSTSTQAVNAPVPVPFDTSTISGFDFGAPLPVDIQQESGVKTQNGIDYGTPVGTRIVSPFAGTAHVETGVKGYGNFVTVTLDNGWTIGFGHVASGAVANGARVNPGDLVAISGSKVGDSTGAVTILTWQDPSGKYVDPHQMIDPIFNGTTFSTLGLTTAAGTGSPTVNATLDREYPSIKTDWTNLFGTPPSPEDVLQVLQHGTSPTQWTDYISSLPGHIPGMTVGQISGLRTTADSVSMTALGHTSTDGIVKELNDLGMTSQAQVKLWYDENSPNQIDKTVYNQIVKVAAPDTAGALNEPGADPRIISAIYNSAQTKGTQTGE